MDWEDLEAEFPQQSKKVRRSKRGGEKKKGRGRGKKDSDRRKENYLSEVGEEESLRETSNSRRARVEERASSARRARKKVELYCTCLCVWDESAGFMIGCDGPCQGWYHPHCLGFVHTKKEATQTILLEADGTEIDATDKWLCPQCAPKKPLDSMSLAEFADVNDLYEDGARFSLELANYEVTQLPKHSLVRMKALGRRWRAWLNIPKGVDPTCETCGVAHSALLPCAISEKQAVIHPPSPTPKVDTHNVISVNELDAILNFGDEEEEQQPEVKAEVVEEDLALEAVDLLAGEVEEEHFWSREVPKKRVEVVPPVEKVGGEGDKKEESTLPQASSVMEVEATPPYKGQGQVENSTERSIPIETQESKTPNLSQEETATTIKDPIKDTLDKTISELEDKNATNSASTTTPVSTTTPASTTIPVSTTPATSASTDTSTESTIKNESTPNTTNTSTTTPKTPTPYFRFQPQEAVAIISGKYQGLGGVVLHELNVEMGDWYVVLTQQGVVYVRSHHMAPRVLEEEDDLLVEDPSVILYKGVTRVNGAWESTLDVDTSKRIPLGRYASQMRAARVYDVAVSRWFWGLLV